MDVHHAHKRKPVSPEAEKWKSFMDKAIYPVSAAGIVMTFPQIAKIYGEKDASGLSLASWVAYLAITLFWLAYGLMHRERPIIFSSAVWIALYIVIIAGIIAYG
ncbi:MAG: hypothetical protein HZB68_01370 [Candidatus Aenigmarchaeota archaeon]|nr:hypothetical protein [Candidatus Aenigmarchaeota archaeon]